MQYLTVAEVEYIAYELAKQMMEWDEPIPPFGTRFPNRLESCLSTPQQSYAKKELYPDFLDKVAVLFYLLVKNHPFQNGNKRIAIMTLIYFCYKNNMKLSLPDLVLYQFSVDVASSDPKKYQDNIDYIRAFLKPHITNR